jgi:hypothetical protein
VAGAATSLGVAASGKHSDIKLTHITRQDSRGGAVALFSVVGVHDDWIGYFAARGCQLHDSLGTLKRNPPRM